MCGHATCEACLVQAPPQWAFMGLNASRLSNFLRARKAAQHSGNNNSLIIHLASRSRLAWTGSVTNPAFILVRLYYSVYSLRWLTTHPSNASFRIFLQRKFGYVSSVFWARGPCCGCLNRVPSRLRSWIYVEKLPPYIKHLSYEH